MELANLMGISEGLIEENALGADRKNNRESLNLIVSNWTSSLPSEKVEQLCQEVGIPAGRVLNAAEQLDDKHLLERGFLPKVEQLG